MKTSIRCKDNVSCIDYAKYYDKVLAGWIGKSLGGVIGAPFENHKQFSNISIDSLWPATVGANDDLDIQVVWLEAIQEQGLFLTSDDLVRFWQDRCAYNFCEYGYFLHNVQRGIAPPLSGRWNNSFFRESEGCPIRSEIWGMVCPGNPSLAAEYARLDGQLDHGGVSVEIEQFLAAALTEAFFADDLEKVLATGLSVISPDSEAAKAVDVVREICKNYLEPFDAWRLLIRRYGNRDASKAITNHAIVLMALFLGKGDFKKTMQICVNSGWDADCTAATAGALLGVMGGMSALPADWTAKLGKNLICGIEVKHKNASLTDFASETCLIGVEMAEIRNHTVEILDAPAVTVRRPPDPKVVLDINYLEDPVLWNSKETNIHLTVYNPLAEPIDAQVCMESPTGVRCSLSLSHVKVPAGTCQQIELKACREKSASWLPDKNLFHAYLLSSKSHQKIAARTFGLGGAHQWLVYGPYWDMWNKDKNEICPYQNDKIICNPGGVGEWSDFYNQYVRPDHPYLDEQKLLCEEIPTELPWSIEKGEDVITERDIGGFHGQACYYFVRKFRSTEFTGQSRVFVGRTGPYRAWLDGKMIGQSQDIRGWAPHEDENLHCQLTGQPQRLVFKFIRLMDVFAFSINFISPWTPEQKRGISYILDGLEDLS